MAAKKAKIIAADLISREVGYDVSLTSRCVKMALFVAFRVTTWSKRSCVYGGLQRCDGLRQAYKRL